MRDGDDERLVTVGGKFSISYTIKDSVVPNGDRDIQTNYRDAPKALGAELPHTGAGRTSCPASTSPSS